LKLSQLQTEWLHLRNDSDPANGDVNDRFALTVITRIQVGFAERLAWLARRLKSYTISDGRSVAQSLY